MSLYCFVQGCNSTQYKSINRENKPQIPFYGFPTDQKVRKKWIDALLIINQQNNASNPPKKARICSLHFCDDCFEQFGFSQVRLKRNSIPTKFPNASTQKIPDNHLPDQCCADPLSTPVCAHQSESTHLMSNSRAQLSEQVKIENHFSVSEFVDQPTSSVDDMDICPIRVTPKKKLRYAGDITSDALEKMSPEAVLKACNILKKACEQKDRQIKRLQTQKCRQKKKIDSLQQLLADVQKRGLMSSISASIVQAVSDERTIIEEIEKGKVKGKYTPSLRAFALTVNFYSPKAYQYIRTIFKNRLPASSTIRSWYGITDGFPGFTTEAIDILKKKVEEAGDNTVFGCLTMDEMAIRRQVEWVDSKKRFLGYVDYGLAIQEPDNLPIAKNVLVYLVTGINQRWKIPVAYFLVDGLTAEELAAITKQVLTFVARSGVKVIALTFDGLPANLAMCGQLGANIYNDKASFRHPSENYDIWVFIDAAHMIKLIRNALAKNVLYDSNGNPIKFEYLASLIKLQEDGHFHLANKLNKQHAQWWKSKMNVKLAAQTLSESCAVSLEQLLADGHPDFTDCAATAKFCRMVNNTFDCLNSRSVSSYGFKRPLNEKTASEIFSFFAEAKEYFSTIQVDVGLNVKNRRKQPILNTKLKTGFFGFLNDMKNLEIMYKEYVIKGCLKYILSYKLSQDHLEVLFSCFRSMGGFNNNPNAKQFASSYRRILQHNEIKSSTSANCIPLDNTSILTAESGKKRTVPPNLTHNFEAEDGVDVDDLPLSCIDPSLDHTVRYLAGFAEKKVCDSLKCSTCIELLNACEELPSEFITRKSKGFLRFPRTDLYTIATVIEKVWHVYEYKDELNHQDSFHRIIHNVFKNINLETLLCNFRDHSMHLDITKTHKYKLIESFMEFYLKAKFSHLGKCYTREERYTFVRHDLTKTILFCGQ